MLKNESSVNKRSWIFLRGLARHAGHWGPFLKIFSQYFPHDEVELLDIRGNGEFVNSPSFVSIDSNVRDLRARSQFLKQGKKVHLLTISFGSMVGTEWAERHPEDLESLILMNTSDKNNSYFFERLRPQNYLNIVKLITQGRKSPMLEKKVMDLVTNSPEDYKEWAERFAHFKNTSKTNFLRQLIAAGRYRFPKHKPKTDILILASEKDHLVHPNCSRQIAESWQLKAHLHPTAGHDIPLEDSKWVCEEIQRWMNCISPQ